MAILFKIKDNYRFDELTSRIGEIFSSRPTNKDIFETFDQVDDEG